MTPAALKAWRKGLSLTQREAAGALGLSWRQYAELESGRAPIRKIHALAVAAVTLIEPKTPSD